MKLFLKWAVLIAWMPLTSIGVVFADIRFGLDLFGSIMIGTISAAIWTPIFSITFASLMHTLWKFAFGIGLLGLSLIMATAVIPESLPVHYYSGLKIILYLVSGLSFLVFCLIFLIHSKIHRIPYTGN